MFAHKGDEQPLRAHGIPGKPSWVFAPLCATKKRGYEVVECIVNIEQSARPQKAVSP